MICLLYTSIDYDKLTIEVWTDGTINAQEAVSLAARVLTENLNLFVNMSDEAAGAEIMVEKTNDDKEKACLLYTSCLRQCAWDPCRYVHWSWYAGRGLSLIHI